MKRSAMAKLAILLGVGCMAFMPAARAQNIFVNLLTTGAAPTTANLSAPAGFSYSGAAPVAGTMWNTAGESTTVPLNTSVGSTSALYNNLSLVDSLGATISPTLNISYYSTVTTGTRVQPSNASGENTIQPGGVMANAWRNYYNGSGNYFTFAFSGLAASTPFDLYFEGGTGGSGQGAGISLAAGNAFGANPASITTANTTANFNSVYGSLFDSTDGGTSYQLMAEGTTWEVLHGQSDASGDFSFLFNGSGSAAYLNGFQLVNTAPVPEPGAAALLLGGLGFLGNNWRLRRRK